MAIIQLTHGYEAIVSDEDFDVLITLPWRAAVMGGGHVYAQQANRSSRSMHRTIMAPGKGLCVDHINGNGLDNRRENLRVCTHAENMRNRKHVVSSTSPYKGIHFDKRRQQWRACIGGAGQGRKHLGQFRTPEEAAIAYDLAAKERYGDFARLNFAES